LQNYRFQLATLDFAPSKVFCTMRDISTVNGLIGALENNDERITCSFGGFQDFLYFVQLGVTEEHVSWRIFWQDWQCEKTWNSPLMKYWESLTSTLSQDWALRRKRACGGRCLQKMTHPCWTKFSFLSN